MKTKTEVLESEIAAEVQRMKEAAVKNDWDGFAKSETRIRQMRKVAYIGRRIRETTNGRFR